jgi:hypothetical protein
MFFDLIFFIFLWPLCGDGIKTPVPCLLAVTSWGGLFIRYPSIPLKVNRKGNAKEKRDLEPWASETIAAVATRTSNLVCSAALTKPTSTASSLGAYVTKTHLRMFSKPYSLSFYLYIPARVLNLLIKHLQQLRPLPLLPFPCGSLPLDQLFFPPHKLPQ